MQHRNKDMKNIKAHLRNIKDKMRSNQEFLKEIIAQLKR